MLPAMLAKPFELPRGPGMTTQMLHRCFFAVSASAAFTLSAGAQQFSPSQPAETVVVTAVSPIVGTDVDTSDIPAALNGVSANDIARENSQNITDTLLQRIPSVTISSETGNDYEPDVQFRGYVATPLSGVPEGLAVYQNGVRINEAFGDEVHWDFIPTVAINSMDVLSNNPIFGLNALGGAIDTQMKTGFTYQGFETDVQGGSFGRVQDSTQFGQQNGHYSAYAALEFASDGGWREFTPSTIRRLYGDLGYQNGRSEIHLNVTAADNLFGAAGTTPIQLVQQNYASVFTTPQTDHNQMVMAALQGSLRVSDTFSLAGTLYYRFYNQNHVDGNGTDAQACGADPTLLCFNDDVSPANDTTGQQLSNPFGPNDTPGEIDRNSTQTNSVGATLQATSTGKIGNLKNNLVMGASVDAGRSLFSASAELGVIEPNFVVVGDGAFLGASGTPISDGPVRLLASNTYFGAYLLDTIELTSHFSVTAGGRFNSEEIGLNDQLNPPGSANSLTSGHSYSHLNPMIGGTLKIFPSLTAYGGFSAANRAPTPLELGCANPNMPCIIDSFLVSDPSLKQVTSQTVEAGLRGNLGMGTDGPALTWKLGVYRTDNSNDILNIPSPLNNGFGYFANVGSTRRQGVEAEVDYRRSDWFFYASYSYLNATYRSAITLAAPDGDPTSDVNGNISVVPGNAISSIPAQRAKFGLDYNITDALKIGSDVLVVSGEYYGGDDANLDPKLPGYTTVNLHASYQLTKNIQVYVLIDNILDQRYYTFATFFDNSNYVGNSSFPNLTDTRSVAPGRPLAMYAGLKFSL
jgi:outer membrane receptor protein involved in Fe transport